MGRYTDTTSPVSSEQAEGPKNVNEVFDCPLKKPELENEPHKYALPVLKLQCPNKISSAALQKEHCENVIAGGSIKVSKVSIGMFTGVVSFSAPSKLYSFMQPLL